MPRVGEDGFAVRRGDDLRSSSWWAASGSFFFCRYGDEERAVRRALARTLIAAKRLFIAPKALFIATIGRSSLQALLALHASFARNFKLQTKKKF